MLTISAVIFQRRRAAVGTIVAMTWRSAARLNSVEVSPIHPQYWLTAVYTRIQSAPGSLTGRPSESTALEMSKLLSSG